MNVGASSNIHQSITSFFFVSWFGSAGEGGKEGSRERERCLGFVHFFSWVQNSVIV